MGTTHTAAKNSRAPRPVSEQLGQISMRSGSGSTRERW
jgi:hypothetical protein